VQMLAYQIDGRHEQAAGHEAFLERMERSPSHRGRAGGAVCLLQARSTLGAPVPGLEDTPLCLHAGYGAREVLTAVGWLTASRRVPFQAGTLSLAQPQDRTAVRHARQERGLPRPHRVPRLRDQRRALSLADPEQRGTGHAWRSALSRKRDQWMAVPALRETAQGRGLSRLRPAWRWSRPRATGR
jgi:hypothetical protein